MTSPTSDAAPRGWFLRSAGPLAACFLAHVAVGAAFDRTWGRPPLSFGLLASAPGYAFLVLLVSDVLLRGRLMPRGRWRPLLAASAFSAATTALVILAPAGGPPVVRFDGADRSDLVWTSPLAVVAAWVASWVAGVLSGGGRARPSEP